MRCVTRFTRRKLCLTRREWSCCVWKHRIQMEPQPERHRHHLARRLHHSREIFEPNRASISARCRIAQSSARSVFHETIKKAQPKWRLVLATAIKHGVAAPAFSASLAYFDSYRAARLPANLLQAQRDFFGAHTYERIDKPGDVSHRLGRGRGKTSRRNLPNQRRPSPITRGSNAKGRRAAPTRIAQRDVPT